jgi:AcrR family transcriptional regulator
MSPRTSQQYREIREEKMTLIMDVALEHFANQGYHGTTINHIAKHAGISKGLMYNYFESKEALLKAIIHKSVNEANKYFDIDRDGNLTCDEFDYFIREINRLLKEKKTFFRLMIQLLLQKDVREQLLKFFQEPDSLVHPGHEPGDNFYPVNMMSTIKRYFLEKNQMSGMRFDPERKLDLFMITMTGFAFRSILSDKEDDILLNGLIELFK